MKLSENTVLFAAIFIFAMPTLAIAATITTQMRIPVILTRHFRTAFVS